MFHVILTFTQFSFFPLLQLFRTRWCKCCWTTKYNTVDDSPESTKLVSSTLNLANQSYNSLWPTVLTQHYIVTFLQIFTSSQTLNTRIRKKNYQSSYSLVHFSPLSQCSVCRWGSYLLTRKEWEQTICKWGNFSYCLYL